MTNTQLQENSKKAVEFLKSLSSEHRLIILCLLVEGPKTVGELLEGTGLEQTSISQHLKKLREADIVSTTRDHRTITYEIQSPLVKKILNLLHDKFCNDGLQEEKINDWKRDYTC